MPTASWARPCHSIRSSAGPFFHAASNTPCALNARPRSSKSWAWARVSAGGSSRSSGMRATPTLPGGSGRPRASRGRALRARPDSSRSRSAICPSWPAHPDRAAAMFPGVRISFTRRTASTAGRSSRPGPRPTVDWHAGSCDADRRRLPPERVRWRCWSRGRLRPGCCAARLPPSARLRPFGRCRPRGPQGSGRATLR